MTPATVRRKAEAVFRRGNPDATNVRIKWTFGPVPVTWADGSEGWSGRFAVSADGYRARTMLVSVDNEGTWVR